MRVLRFLREEDGAVTVDWVVLTAAVIGIAMVALNPIFTGTNSIASKVSQSVSTAPIGQSASGG